MNLCPPLYSGSTLIILLMIWIVVSIVTSYGIYSRAFNKDPATHWVLMGNLTSSSISFRVRNTASTSIDFQVAPMNDAGSKFLYELSIEQGAEEVRSFYLRDLTADTDYVYKCFNSDTKALLQQGSFRTAPPLNSTLSFRFVASACSNTGSTNEVYDVMLEQKLRDSASPLLFMLHLGDFHYEDLNTPSVPERVKAVDVTLGAKNARQFFGDIPIAYMWDDHDFLGNNAGGLDANEENLQAALEQYRSSMPHYPLANASHSMNHAFTIGRVRFVVSDLRSEQGAFVQIMSNEQEEWLLNEFSQSDRYDFVVWATSVPWIGINQDPSDPSDAWWGHPEQRQRISAFLSSDRLPKRNVIAISADSHMVAFDDGSYTYYGGGASSAPSFPILQTGPLDRFGSFKGGPFTEGCYANRLERNHQFSVVEYSNGSKGPCLTITAYAVSDITSQLSEIFVKELCGGDVFALPRGGGSCKVNYFSISNFILLALSVAFLLASLTLILTSPIFDTWLPAILMALIVTVSVGLVYGMGGAMPYLVGGTALFDSFSVAMIGMLATLSVFGFLVAWLLDPLED
eukprot:scaffold12194_cov129-Cylindrotheca_fusiformis.AAC.18